LAAFEKRYLRERKDGSDQSKKEEDRRREFPSTNLEVEVLKNFDQRLFEPRDLESVLDPTDEKNRIDLSSNVLEKTTNET